MKAIYTAALFALCLPLAQAATEFSQPQTDWQKPVRDGRMQASQNRYHPPVGAKSDVIFNQDGSITFTNPQLVRGPKLLPINSAYSDPDGACALFGMDSFLADTLETQNSSPRTMAAIDESGKYNSKGEWSGSIAAITCAYRGAQYETGTFSEVFENPDGSVTMIQPLLLRGNKPLAISTAYSDPEGICRLFGFDAYLEESLKSVTLNSQSLAAIDESGKYNSQGTWTAATASISCYMRGDLQQTGFARKTSRNLDKSVTIYNPSLIRGSENLPVSAAYSDPEGVCRLFGFHSYLEDSLESANGKTQTLSAIDEAGQYNSRGAWSGVLNSITCFNGRYRTTALAGGMVFQDGAVIGKMRRSHSRWAQQPAPIGPQMPGNMIMPPLK